MRGGEGFRRITYFPDRPDVMAVFTTRVEADTAEVPVLLANGNLVAAGDVAGTSRHFAVWHDPFPKPSYLFALVGGALAARSAMSRTSSSPCRAAASRCASMSSRAAKTAPGSRWTRLQAVDALGRAGVRPRITISTSS